jgi:predicted nucleic acid-binding protein
MKDKFFLDTNVLVYSFDDSVLQKRDRAKDLIHQGLETGAGVISYQVIQEFFNIATKKFSTPLNTDDCKIYLSLTLRPLLQVNSSIDLFNRALEIKQKHKFSFYDSLILSAAIISSCKILYSEDFQDGYKLDKLKIINPFA